MAMNFANGQYHTSDHVDVVRGVRQARTGTVANPAVPTVAGFLQNPTPTFTTPHAFNPGHLISPAEITGANYPMTKTARSAIWSTFRADVSHWYQGFHPRTPQLGQTGVLGDSSHPGPLFL